MHYSVAIPRYYSIFKDWDGVRAYRQDEISWGLYTEFDAEAAKYLALLDAELQKIKEALVAKCPNLDLSTVMPIQERIIQQYGMASFYPSCLEFEQYELLQYRV